jgi:predicted Ser/Thr protein kinase
MAALDPLISTTLERFTIDRVLGEGGMGRVYAGRELATGREVAIKVISQEHAGDPELISRFYAEANAASRIRHPNIVETLALAYVADGRPAIVMELVEGNTLRETLAGGLIPLDDVIEIATQVLDAVGAAHDAGIIHRDLKPDNIVIGPTGRVKVLDFGIAKLATTEPGQAAPRTRTGMLMGTPEYMAPEQITGGLIDARTDLYAVGVIMYEMLTGQRPFAGDNQFAVLRAHVDTPPPSPLLLRADLPEALARMPIQAMAKSPTQRYASARAMSAALFLTRTSKTTSRAWPLAIAACAVFVAIGVVAGVVAHRHRAIAPPPPKQTVTAPAPNPLAPPANPDVGNYPGPAHPRTFDPMAFLADGERLARDKISDAELIVGEFYAVASDGTLDLGAQPQTPTWLFWSPSVASRRPKTLAANVPFNDVCIVALIVSASSIETIREKALCDYKRVARPRCSLRQLWDRAKKKGAKSSYMAHITWTESRWFFRFDNVPDNDQLSLIFDDNC